MTKLIIEHAAAASEQIEPLDFGTTSRFLVHGTGIDHKYGLEANPGTWLLKPYERYLEIEVDMRWVGPNIVTVKREIQDVTVVREGTPREALNWHVWRTTTMHYLDGNELGAVWTEIERRKTEGVRLQVNHLSRIAIDPCAVVNCVGI